MRAILPQRQVYRDLKACHLRVQVDDRDRAQVFSVEKEALALVWEKFQDYVLGKEIQLETDHKSLVTLLGKTYLDCLLPRILRFLLHLMRFSYSIRHVPGKELYTADVLSLAPLPASGESMERFVDISVSTLPASTDHLQGTAWSDTDCAQLIHLCRSGWLNHKHQAPENMRHG